MKSVTLSFPRGERQRFNLAVYFNLPFGLPHSRVEALNTRNGNLGTRRLMEANGDSKSILFFASWSKDVQRAGGPTNECHTMS
jgi:hypothetical protein